MEIEMDQVRILMEEDDGSWRQRCNERMEILKAKAFPSSEEPPSQPTILLQEEIFGGRNFEILELLDAIHNGNVEGFVDVLEQLSSDSKLPLSAIFNQVISTDESLLHIAADFGKAEIAELIGHHFPHLLTKKNIKGETPLHIAARKKRADVIRIILSQYAAHKSTSSRENNNDEELTRMINQHGNTALHVAVAVQHIEGVTLLFQEDKCVAHYLNKFKVSPLYVAVTLSNKEIINVLLKAPFPNNKPLPMCQGNSPLHAIMATRRADLLMEILDKKSDLMYLRGEDGGTPLHFAAFTNYVEGVCMLLEKSTLIALQQNTKGHLPIHIACKWGHVKVLKEFLKEDWADSTLLYNKKGQNILHVAANNGRLSVVKYLLRESEFMPFILNEPDKNGNTPLHLAAKNSFPHILFYLTQAKGIVLNIPNDEGFTALDIIIMNMMDVPSITGRQNLSYFTLAAAGCTRGQKAAFIFQKRGVPPQRESLKNTMNTLMVVAALIVTVTFAAGFTLPGSVYGSESKPHERGMAVLSKRTMFKVFVAMDTVAMYSSILGCFALLWAQLRDFFEAAFASQIALLMVIVALLAMNVAFLAGVSLVVSNVPGLASFVIVMGIISICIMASILAPVFLLPLIWIMPCQISYLVFRYLVFQYELLVPNFKEKVKKLQSPASQAE